ncbi:MAG: hypothetical protein OXF20_06740 [Gammaproteobacteria bacterium]|nr:hypothetical protein [Gammaproteobacteria bacterium]
MSDQISEETLVSDFPVRQRWEQLKLNEPFIRQRDAAEQLGISEVEVVAMQCGDGVRRLDALWPELIKQPQAWTHNGSDAQRQCCSREDLQFR